MYKKRTGTEQKGKKLPMDETIVKEDAINDQEEESDADDDEPTQTKQHRVTESNPTLATDDPIEELTKDISSDEEIDEISLSPVSHVLNQKQMAIWEKSTQVTKKGKQKR